MKHLFLIEVSYHNNIQIIKGNCRFYNQTLFWTVLIKQIIRVISDENKKTQANLQKKLPDGNILHQVISVF